MLNLGRFRAYSILHPPVVKPPPPAPRRINIINPRSNNKKFLIRPTDDFNDLVRNNKFNLPLGTTTNANGTLSYVNAFSLHGIHLFIFHHHYYRIFLFDSNGKLYIILFR